MKGLILLFVLTSQFVFSQTSKPIVSYPNNSGNQARNYSEVVSVDLGTAIMLTISGQVALNEKGELVGKGDFEKQTIQVFENLKTIVIKNGGTMANIIKTNIYLTDITNLDTFRRIRKTYFDSINPPASTLVQVSGLFRNDLLIEIEAVAIIPKSSTH